MTMNVWITRERIQLASELLARPGHNIAEIGWTCGFTSPSYFIRVFRAHTGMTPRIWRRTKHPA
jgi:AraC-like DNA-binding protein